jgi:Zn-dependent protease
MVNDRENHGGVLTGILCFFLLISAVAGAPTTEPTTLVPAMGTMIIDSSPSDASIYIDGSLKGTTPFTSNTITAGDHTVTLTMTGYEKFITTVTVPPGGTIQGVYTMVPEITTTTSLPRTGTMIIESIPSGASVYIDGSLKGTTPFTSNTITAGDHTVTLKMTGYADFPSTATIPSGGEFHEIYTMSCNILSVSSVPSGASLYIDGSLIGTTPQTIRAIPAGDHSEILKLTGYEDYTTMVNIPPGTEIGVVYTMASVSKGNPVSTDFPAVSVTIQTPVTREITTTIPTATTGPVPVLLTTRQISQKPSGNCTMRYFGFGKLDTKPDGRLNCTTLISTVDNILTIHIKEDTLITDAEKKPVSEIRTKPVNSSDIPSGTGPGGSMWTSHAYHFLPDNTSFDSPFNISFTLSQAEWERSDPANLTIKGTNKNQQGWEDLPTSIDFATRTVSAQANHFSIIGLFSSGPVVNSPATGKSPRDIIRGATGFRDGPLPVSPVIPDKYAPLAAICAGIAVCVTGTFVNGSTILSRLWSKISGLLEKFLGSETIGLMNLSEIEKRGIRPAENLAVLFFSLSSREILVIGLSTLGFAAAFILQDHLKLELTTVIIFVCIGGIATILHDLAHKYCAYRAGCITEYQFWSLGTVTMLSTAWLFGNAFAKPSRTLIRSEKVISPENAAIIKLAGPLMSMGVAVVSLFLIPLGGLFAIAGSAGFSMNLLNSVFSLVPVKPNDGVEIYAWNKFIWGIVFLPLIAFYLYIYLSM